MPRPPHEWEFATHALAVHESLERSGLLDFLSERAQVSVELALSRAVMSRYQRDPAYRIARYDLSKLVRSHPLGYVLGDDWCRMVAEAVAEEYFSIES